MSSIEFCGETFVKVYGSLTYLDLKQELTDTGAVYINVKDIKSFYIDQKGDYAEVRTSGRTYYMPGEQFRELYIDVRGEELQEVKAMLIKAAGGNR